MAWAGCFETKNCIQRYTCQIILTLAQIGQSCLKTKSFFLLKDDAALLKLKLKLYIPSTLNIDLILWHTQLIVCAENVKSWFKSWVFIFTFQAYNPAPYIELYVC